MRHPLPHRPIGAVGIIIVLLSVGAMGLAPPAAADTVSRFDAIAVTVNNSIISYRDLENKIVFTLNLLGLDDTLENRDRIRPQALQSLIDENLQNQETRRHAISVDDRQVERALERIASLNSASVEDFTAYLASRNVSLQMFRDQLRVQLGWQNLVDARLRPRIQISDEEIDTMIDFYRDNQGKEEYHIAEIYLPFDDPASRHRAYSQGREIVALIEDSPIDERRKTFQSLARQLSQSASAIRGGDIGWVTGEQIDRKLRDVLTRTEPGTISGPREVDNGVYILFVDEKRVIGQQAPATVTLSKITLPTAADSPQAKRLGAAIRAHIAQRPECSRDDLPPSLIDVAIADLGTLRIEDFPQHIRQAIHGLKKGDVTDPIVESAERSIMLRLCAKTLPQPSLPGRDQIAQRLELQRLQKMVEKQMRDLRRRAYIDLRTGNDSG